jgi:hypothetical protein
VIEALGYVIIAAGLAYAVWGFVAARLDRAPGRALFTGAWVLSALVALWAVVAVAFIAGGREVQAGLLVGYLLTALILEPAAIYLAKLEPTKWGSVILASGALVLGPLFLRLLQIWGLGG